MIIESPDLLKQWLTGFLSPLCDADPEALAKYCLALVRKDRPESELRQGIMEQLDVFLQGNTKSFVDKFLQVVHARSYVPKSSSSSNTNNNSNSTPLASSSSSSSTKVNTEDTIKESQGGAASSAVASNHSNSSHFPDSTTASPSPVVTATGTVPAANGEPTPPPPPASAPAPPPPPEVAPPMPPSSVITRKEEVSSSQRTRKQDIDMRDRDDRPPRGRRSPSPIGRGRSRSRSRSRSRDRRRSRSRGRSGRSKYDDRRRRSPPSKRYRRSRTRSRTRSPRRSRSPRHDRERKSKSRNRTRSTSPRGRTGRVRSPVLRSPSSPVKAVIIEEKAENSPTGGSSSPVREVRAPSESANSTLLQSMVTKPPPKQRCRDYDEKGYCMRGDMCPYDHGSDPVVLEGIGGVLDFPPPPVPGTGPPTAPGYTPVPVPPQGVPRPRGPPPRQQFDEYTPRAPGIWGSQPPVGGPDYFGSGPRTRFTAPPPPLPGMPGGNRELINISSGGSVRPSLAKRLGPAIGNLSGPRAHKPPSGMEKLTLELRNIPAGLNSISHLNDHFGKFGKINNIMVEHEGSPDAALVTFSSYSEANAAYRSTEAVLNNRFIKVFWHYPTKNENPNFNGGGQRSVLDRLGTRHVNKSLNNTIQETSSDEKSEKVIMSRGNLVKTVYNTSAVASMGPPDSTQSAVDQKKQEIDAIIKQRELMQAEFSAKNKQEKQKAEALKLKAEMEKRKQQLMEKQIQQLKVLLSRLETNKTTMKSEEKKTLLSTIKSLQSAIDITREQLLVNKKTTIIKPQTGPKLDKEILDTELELYNSKAEGGDISRLQNKLILLKQTLLQQQQQLTSSGHVRGRGHHPYARGGYTMVRGSVRGRGGVRGRGRGRGYGGQFASVDRRTTKINASGFEREDKEEVLAHFSNLGTITTYDWDDQTPAVNIIYSSRRDAEKAMAEGRTLGDRLLTLTWVYDAHPPPHIQPITSSMPAAYHQSHTPHSTTPTLSNDETMEEITEEIVEEVETEGSLIGDGESSVTSVIYEEEEEAEDKDEEARSWRR